MKKFPRRNRSLFNALLIVSVLAGLFPSAALSAPAPAAIEPTGSKAMAIPYEESVAGPSSRGQAGRGLPSPAEALTDSGASVPGDATAIPLAFSISTAAEPGVTIEGGEVAAESSAGPATHLTADTSPSINPTLYDNVSSSLDHLPALAIPSEQAQPVTYTWDFESGVEGWNPSDYGGTGMSFWEEFPAYGGSVGVWRAPRYGENMYIYIYYPHLVSLDQVSVDYFIRESGFNVGGAQLTVYTSTDMINWVTVAIYPYPYLYEPSGGGHYTLTTGVEIDDKYVMLRLRLKRAFVETVYGYIDSVTFRNCIGCDILPSDQTWAPNECPLSNSSQAQNRVGGPVNTSSGNYNYQQQDISIATLGQPLRFERSYNSGAAELYTTTLGYGWTHNYDIDLAFEPSTVILKAPHGSRLRFVVNGDGTYSAWPGVWGEMVQVGSTYVVTATNQTVYTFDGDGHLVSLRDPQGNVTQFTYSGGQLSRVTEPTGQRYLDLLRRPGTANADQRPHRADGAVRLRPQRRPGGGDRHPRPGLDHDLHFDSAQCRHRPPPVRDHRPRGAHRGAAGL